MEVVLLSSLFFLFWYLSKDGKDKVRYKHHLKNIDEEDLGKPIKHIIEKHLEDKIGNLQYRSWGGKNSDENSNHAFRNKSNKEVILKTDNKRKNIRSIFSGNISQSLEKYGEENSLSSSKKLIQEFPEFSLEDAMDVKYHRKFSGNRKDLENLTEEELEDLWLDLPHSEKSNIDPRFKSRKKDGSFLWKRIKDD